VTNRRSGLVREQVEVDVEAGDVLDALRSRWRVVLGVAAVVVAVSGLLLLVVPRTYVAHARLFVSAASAGEAGSFSDVERAQQLAPTFARLTVGSGLAQSPARLRRRLSASSPPGTVVIDVSARGRTAADARDLADAVCEQAVVTVHEVGASAGLGGTRLTVAEAAELPDGPAAPRRALDLMLATAFGLGSGCASALVLAARTRTRRGRGGGPAADGPRSAPSSGTMPASGQLGAGPSSG
jgi:succinoglycan biosynthesis transport protein ExoP